MSESESEKIEKKEFSRHFLGQGQIIKCMYLEVEHREALYHNIMKN